MTSIPETPMTETDLNLTAASELDLIVLDPQPLDRNPAAVYLGGLSSKRSQSTQRQSLQVLAQMLTGAPDLLHCNWSALRFQHAARVRSELAGRYAPATANRILSALRGVALQAFNLEYMSAEDYTRIKLIKGIRGKTLPAGRALGGGEVAAILGACENDPTPAGARDAALFVCMYPAGLRREEVAALDLESYNAETGALTVLHGKGNKARMTYLVNGARRAMADWMAIRGNEPGPLFYPVNKGGHLQPRRMTNQAVYNCLLKRGDQAGVKDLSPHDLRRTFISDLLDAGADISTIAGLAGHASVTTTQRYDRRPEAAKAKAANLLHVPYKGRMV